MTKAFQQPPIRGERGRSHADGAPFAEPDTFKLDADGGWESTGLGNPIGFRNLNLHRS